MTDELVKRLRANASWGDDRFSEAADRIEQLQAQNLRLSGMCYDLTAESDRLRIALTDAKSYLGKCLDKMAYNILRAALKGESND